MGDLKLENVDTDSGVISIEDGFNFIKKLRAEAKRQADIKVAKLEHATFDIEELPLMTTDAEYDRIADSFEIYEEDD